MGEVVTFREVKTTYELPGGRIHHIVTGRGGKLVAETFILCDADECREITGYEFQQLLHKAKVREVRKTEVIRYE